MRMSTIAALTAGATITSGLPVLVGWSARLAAHRGLRLLWWWVAVAFLTNLGMASLAVRGQRTVGFAMAALPLLAWLGIATLAGLAERALITAGGWLAAIFFTVWWGACVVQQEYRADFTTYSAPLLAVLLTIGAVLLVLVRLRDAAPRPTRDYRLLTGFAVLVSYAPSAAIEPIATTLFPKDPAAVLALYGARAVLLMIGSLLFAYALWRAPSLQR